PKLPPPDLKPSPRPDPKPEQYGSVEHRIMHDLVNQTVTVRLRSVHNEKTDDGATTADELTSSDYTVSQKNPAEATLRVNDVYTIQAPGGLFRIEASEVVASDITSFRYITEVDVKVDGKPHFSKSWTISVPRKLN